MGSLFVPVNRNPASPAGPTVIVETKPAPAPTPEPYGAPPISMPKFFDSVRESLFNGALKQTQVDGLNAIVNTYMRDYWFTYPDARKLAYILATAYHETAKTMQPVRETLASNDDTAIARLESSWSKGRLPWVKTPYWRKDADGKSWLGRGYVQLTHRYNYEKAGYRLNVDLVGDPSLAMKPDIAAQILIRGSLEGWFTTKKLGDYFNSVADDPYNARRVINGTDKAEIIRVYHVRFLDALKP